ncbi:MAG: two-component sensor histidine kinase [Alphaproteobacteria bacterium]|nr:two-component sensor histidine kinase [Alphaproteobacteria bacterium]
MLAFFWPKSLRGQVLLAIALALFLAQGVGALLLYRAQHERIEGALVHTAAFRLAVATRAGPGDERPPRPRGEMPSGHHMHGPPPLREGARIERASASPWRPGDRREVAEEAELKQTLAEQDIPVAEAAVFRRSVKDDPAAQARLARRLARDPDRAPPGEVLIAAVRLQNAESWMVARVFVPPAERLMLRTLFVQTLLIYGVLVGAMWLLLRRITRPLAALTTRFERFADTRDPDGRLEPEGPEDVARLIAAHNAMEARIVALLDEKDVMLGAIGHDLKTPLAALRVRIESVENETERARMAATIEDITRSLDDILSLARVGRPSDPHELTELSALVASVVEEYEDMGEPVELGDTVRAVLPLRPTWVRRGLRNLIGNALRYGGTAHVSLTREDHTAVIRITDDGPGIPDDQIARMLEPFTRGEPSRNSVTGGAGLGLTLARAIAEQHGGTLVLANRHGHGGAVSGLEATLRLPLA